MDPAHDEDDPWGEAAEEEVGERAELSREWAARRELFYNVRSHCKCRAAADPPMLTVSGAEATVLGCRLAIEKAWTRARARLSSKALMQARST